VTRYARRATVLAALVAAPMFTLAAPALAADSTAAPTAVVRPHHTRPTKPAPSSTATTRPPATPASTPTSAAASAPAGSSADFEAQVVTLTNAQRAANGCGALRVDSRLVAAARAHSNDMLTQKFFSHTGSNGSDFVAREAAAGYTAGASAENIAWGYRTPQDVVTGWMESPGHRANILACTSVATGVGVARMPDGTPYWTQDFGRI